MLPAVIAVNVVDTALLLLLLLPRPAHTENEAAQLVGRPMHAERARVHSKEE